MCFTCQRNLNEKRRTERKRVTPSARGGQQVRSDGFHDDGSAALGTIVPSIIYAIGGGSPAAKRFKTSNGGILELTHDAVIINAPSELFFGLVPSGVGAAAAKAHTSDDVVQHHHSQTREDLEAGEAPNSDAADSGDRDVGSSSVHDVSGGGLLRSAREALADVERLMASSGEEEHGGLEGSTSAVAAAAATAAAVAAAVTAAGEGGGEVSHHDQFGSAEAAASAVHLLEQHHDDSLSRVDVANDAPPNVQALYETALKSLLRSVYLLHQWKTSWDAAVETVSDPHFADAVASAAAVAAAAHASASAADNATFHAENTSFHAENSTFPSAAPTVPAEQPLAIAPGSTDPHGSNMVSLLLAADDKQRQTGEGGEEQYPEASSAGDRGSSLEDLSHTHHMIDGEDIVQDV
jgi:hypothetical protein